MTLGTTLVGPTSALISASLAGSAGPAQVTAAFWQTGEDVACAPVRTVSESTLSLLVTGLQPSADYQFEVVANVGAATGLSSTATLITLAQGTIAQRVTAGQTLLGRLTLSQARARLLAAANVPVRFGYRGALWQATPAQLGAHTLIARTLTAAANAAPGTTIAAPTMQIDGSAVRRYVAGLARRYNRQAAAASVRLVGTHAEITAPRPATTLDQATLVAAIEHELTHGVRARLQLPTRTSRALQTGAAKAVVVRLDTETLTAYLNGKPVLTTPVTTGRPALPTPIGSFSVQFKASPYVFHSPWAPGSPFWYPPTPVTWAMEFYDGDFLHDDPAEPDSAFGSDSQNGYFASHGCVHIPHDAMAFLYGWLPVGAPVIIARS